jgi:dimethylargininase
MLAITHMPSPQMQQCQRTFVAQTTIDYETAVQQHAAYCQLLQKCGANVSTLNVNCEFPDCAFIEDTAIVFDEVAVLASMGTASRRAEPTGIEPELSRYREICRVEPPATIEGGDVLRVARTLLVGLSTRTNHAGVNALEAMVGRFGYRVVTVPVLGCLHLKTACTALPDNRLLVNPSWLDVQALRPFAVLPVPEQEPWAANVLVVGEKVMIATEHVRTAHSISKLGFNVQTVDVSEFAKAEGGITCLSLIL